MDITAPITLLGGLSPAVFMRRHWQKLPLMVRQAWPGVRPPLARSALFDLMAQEGVESRLLTAFDDNWRLRHGPFQRRALPALKRPGWTLLVQGLDLHNDAAHAMLQSFRFVPEARLDDLMMSYASDGGGVGPHLDSYDVFLLQVHGQRRWRIGPVADRTLVEGRPVKILQNFEPTDEWLLGPGDMLYLPPQWGHDGVAVGDDCMTCSIGFRASRASELAQSLLIRLGEDFEAAGADPLYRDAGALAASSPGRVPVALQQFAQRAVQRALGQRGELSRALGCVLTEPKPDVWFEASDSAEHPKGASIRLDRRSRMMYDDQHVFINGEAFRASGRDAQCMARLADERALAAALTQRLSAGAARLIADWAQAGWLHLDAEGEGA